MSTDTGIDLVAYAPSRKYPATIQVKTNLKPKPGGGKGRAAIDWWLSEDSPAELVAFVNLEAQAVWVMSHAEVQKYAQQHSSGKYHLYMYTDPAAFPKKGDRLAHAYEFEAFRLENRASKLFGI
jgi:hypothetical protein